MVDSTKLLVILSDVAYIAELLPAKKSAEFSLHACKQINGAFITDKGMDENAVAKLLGKLEESDEYLLVLPDSLFVDTMVSIKETVESKIEAELKKSVLADLKLSDGSHHLKTITLNEFKGVTRVQIVAIPKAPLALLRVANDASKNIKGFCPLSWVVKGVISLEPSISVVQLGEELYVSQHYFGVDQTSSAHISNPEKIVETVKTLKGAEPSIQTTYVLTNSLIEDQLKEALSSVLPIQQVSSKHDSDQLPAHVLSFLQVAAKTLSVKEYQVPIFHLDPASESEKEKLAAVFTSTTPSSEDKEDTLPKPAQPKKELDKEKLEEQQEADAEEIEEVENADATTEAEADEGPAEKEIEEPQEMSDDSSNVEEKDTEESSDDSASVSPVTATISPTVVSPVIATTPSVESEPKEKAEATSSTSSEEKTPLDKTSDEDIDLSQFAQHAVTAEPVVAQSVTTQAAVEKKPIKHSSGVGNMLKMILITTVAFIITIGVGVGVGLGVIKFAVPQEETTTPVVEVEEVPEIEELEPTETATDSASESEDADVGEIDLAKLKVLVVNATTKAGYAGTIRTQLLAGDFSEVTAGNARGTYDEPGTYIYLKNGGASVTAAITDATKLVPEVSEDAKAEDAQGQYDVVLVLAE